MSVIVALILLLPGAVPANTDIPFSQGRLFLVEGGGEKASYVFGTMHSEDKRVVSLPPAVKQAFDKADHLALELMLDSGAMLASMTRMVLTDDRDLEAITGAALYSEVVVAMAELGMPEMAVRQLKPWAVIVLLSTPPPKTGLFLDMLLYQSAMSQGKEVSGLETAEEQLGIFEGLTEKEQVTLLAETLEQRHQLAEILDEMTGAYLRGDLGALVKLNEEHGPAEKEMAKRLNERLLDHRNQKMVERMLPLLRQGNTFVAVGALHLPGSQGVLNLLQGRGLRVTVVH